ncbi:hypothetical protein [Sphingomonas sp.]|jgi:hypothetical protein|uniref:hypothetical protein n=1 Tax=Sphingomonas sp. TaxID=28214 RepID=UPI002613D064|nr:hypothetical protein [Sphingomonas sp.]MDF2495077.1 hypothetical protein [Sphingomonas sp.]
MSQDLGTAVERDGKLVWAGTGRPLTGYEQRMRSNCGCLWLPLFGGIFLLAPSHDAICAFEKRHDRGIGTVHGYFLKAADVERERSAAMPVNGGGWPPFVRPAAPTREQMLEIITMAVAGGARAVTAGRIRTFTAAEAAAIVQFHLADAPSSELEPIVAAVVAHVIHGGEPSPEELAAFTIGVRNPVVPGWVLAA